MRCEYEGELSFVGVVIVIEKVLPWVTILAALLRPLHHSLWVVHDFRICRVDFGRRVCSWVE